MRDLRSGRPMEETYCPFFEPDRKCVHCEHYNRARDICDLDQED